MTKQQTRLLIGLGAGVLVVACVSVVVIWWAINSGSLQLGPAVSLAVPALAPTSTPTQEEIYAQDMEAVLQRLQAWTDGPVTEWDTLMGSQVPGAADGLGYGAYLQGILMLLEKGWPIDLPYPPSSPESQIISAAGAMADQGFEVLSEMEAVMPPAQIRTAHNKVTNCVRYEIDRSNAIISALTTGTFDDPGPDQCKQLELASAQVLEFIEEHR